MLTVKQFSRVLNVAGFGITNKTSLIYVAMTCEVFTKMPYRLSSLVIDIGSLVTYF